MSSHASTGVTEAQQCHTCMHILNTLMSRIGEWRDQTSGGGTFSKLQNCARSVAGVDISNTSTKEQFINEMNKTHHARTYLEATAHDTNNLCVWCIPVGQQRLLGTLLCPRVKAVDVGIKKIKWGSFLAPVQNGVFRWPSHLQAMGQQSSLRRLSLFVPPAGHRSTGTDSSRCTDSCIALAAAPRRYPSMGRTPYWLQQQGQGARDK